MVKAKPLATTVQPALQKKGKPIPSWGPGWCHTKSVLPQGAICSMKADDGGANRGKVGSETEGGRLRVTTEGLGPATKASNAPCRGDCDNSKRKEEMDKNAQSIVSRGKMWWGKNTKNLHVI